MDIPKTKINDKEVVVVDKELFKDLVYKTAAHMQEDKRRKICSLKDALEILGCSKTTLYKLLADPKTRIKKSTVKGKYQVESLERELKRLEKTK